MKNAGNIREKIKYTYHIESTRQDTHIYKLTNYHI